MAQKLSYYAYKVKFNFKGEDDTTLNVKKGDIVLGSEKSLPPGAWVLVQQSVAPHRHGYVPAQYLERAQEEAFMEKAVELPDGSTKDKLVHRGTKVIDKLLKDNNAHFYDDFGNWNSAIKEFGKGKYWKAFDLLQYAPEGTTSRVSFNQGVVCFLTGHIQHAVFFFSQAVTLDRHLAAAHFMRGVSFYRARDYLQAFMDFSTTLDILKPNEYIDYVPLGLEFVLWKGEVLYNRSLAFAGMKMFDRALHDIQQSKKISHCDQHTKQAAKLERELKMAQDSFDISTATTNSEMSEAGSDLEEGCSPPSSPAPAAKAESSEAEAEQSVAPADKQREELKRKVRSESKIVSVDKAARLTVQRPSRGPPAPPGAAPSPPTAEQEAEELLLQMQQEQEVQQMQEEEAQPKVLHRKSMVCLEPPKDFAAPAQPAAAPQAEEGAPEVPSQPPPRKPRRNIQKASLLAASP
mmetsp:Transcript_11346/g.46075  ORF Transcript_11346/g.46075 Transcript_11346/m.46075 type:complete len:462 (+) Transcript_11346:192-1577(+)|eukprot:CAMPEP_0114620532 /NCGR_PEP_ID=MMETSP0168-20121206/8773_1 /TAXON_ID=95228 ORGANISM="Vannella sp., Strain DIVA3 517/6/12" /NCGR_SAMPLE_ID=MMETSP0168 /ASSEMBLY_ACC=CAM_ASM_000044 /LENGTH=461 /DNA_ID=CAMNT_0001831725 /DNA_START=121 /DNA_END=1506 /DNA_ORIENTATION=-